MSNNVVGSGVTDENMDAGVCHNPKFSTSRGARRHEKRNEQQKAHAAKTWNTAPPKTWHKPESCNHQSCKANRRSES